MYTCTFEISRRTSTRHVFPCSTYVVLLPRWICVENERTTQARGLLSLRWTVRDAFRSKGYRLSFYATQTHVSRILRTLQGLRNVAVRRKGCRRTWADQRPTDKEKLQCFFYRYIKQQVPVCIGLQKKIE